MSHVEEKGMLVTLRLFSGGSVAQKQQTFLGPYLSIRNWDIFLRKDWCSFRSSISSLSLEIYLACSRLVCTCVYAHVLQPKWLRAQAACEETVLGVTGLGWYLSSISICSRNVTDVLPNGSHHLPTTDQLSEKLWNENRISITEEFQRNKTETTTKKYIQRLLHLELLVIGYTQLARMCYVSMNYDIVTKSDLLFLELLVFVLVL